MKILKSCVLLITFLLYTFGFSSCSHIVHNQMQYYVYDDHEKYKAGNFNFPVGEIENISIDWYVGDILIKKSSENKFIVSENGSAQLAENQKLHWFFDKNTLTIKYCSSGYTGSKIEGKNKYLSLELPDNINLEIHNEVGDIELKENVLADLKVDNKTGDIKFTKNTLKHMNIFTGTGDIKAREIISDNINLKNGTGNIEISLFDCRNAVFDSGVGDIKIELLNELGATIGCKTSVGDFDISGDFKKVSDKHIIGDGKCKIKIKAGVGDVFVGVS